MKIAPAIAAFFFLTVAAHAQQTQSPAVDPQACPMHDAHAQMNQRGEHAMGFSQTSTTHHFLLKSDGGDIQVEANDPADSAETAQIRIHLQHIADAFQSGNFDIPMFVHDTVPPGVPDMKRLQKNIRYTFEQTAAGGRVSISTTDKDAIAAVHAFLRFQMKEHATGDSTDVR